MIPCTLARRRILRSRDDQAELEADPELRAHLARCTACLRLRRRALALERALAELPAPPVSSLDLEQAVARVRARCEQEDELPAPAPRLPRIAAAGAVAAGLAAATLVAVALVHDDGPGLDPGPDARRVDVPALDPEEPEPASAVVARTAEHESPAGDAAHEPREGEVASQDGPRSAAAVEAERVEGARRRVRAALAAAREAHPEAGDVGSLAAAVDRGLAPLAREGWPVTRLVERFVDEPDPALAVSAARYLGSRGDRLSARCLARRLAEVASTPAAPRDLRDALVLALGASGEDGLAALGPAAREPDLAADVLRVARTVGGELAVLRTVEVVDALEGLPAAADRRREALDLLAGLGRPGVEGLLGLGARGDVAREVLLAALAAAPGVRAPLLELVEEGPDPAQVDFVLAVLGRLELTEALDWVEERGRDRRHRDAAAACLAELGSFEALASTFALRDAGLLPEGAVEAGLERLAARRPGALPAHVRRLAERGDLDGLEAALAVLLEVEADWAGAGLTALARTPRLEEDRRTWAALAVGEVGAVAELAGLVELLQSLESGRERLAAACLLSIHALGGRASALEALAPRGGPPAEVLELLEQRARGRSLAASLYKLARRIEPWLDPDTRDPRRMTP